MEWILCRVVESSCSPTHNIFLHISSHDLPYHPKSFLHREKRVEHLTRILFVSSVDPHEMSLNIDMKIIRPLNCDGSPILLMNSWTLLQSCNVVNPWKIFHSKSIGSPSILSKVLYSDELLNHVNLSSHTIFD